MTQMDVKKVSSVVTMEDFTDAGVFVMASNAQKSSHRESDDPYFNTWSLDKFLLFEDGTIKGGYMGSLRLTIPQLRNKNSVALSITNNGLPLFEMSEIKSGFTRSQVESMQLGHHYAYEVNLPDTLAHVLSVRNKRLKREFNE